jgi:glutamate/tyrosine decarboxylase-like PLP-dependent enzyme
MDTDRRLLHAAADLAADFLDNLDTRPIPPRVDYRGARELLDRPLPEDGTAPERVLAELAADGEPGITGMQSGRFFGFVIGGALPAPLAADWLAAAWDQNTGLAEVTPTTCAVEEVAGRWLAEILGLPQGVSFGFVTGCQMAHVTALAAARHAVYERIGWDVPQRGVNGAPPLRVVVGAARHVTVPRALRLLGIGRDQEVVVEADDQGRMRPDRLAAALDPDVPTIVCAQAGEVNTGSFDDIGAIVDLAHPAGAWVHVDGAFGLWAAASPDHRHLVAGHDRADSWATDAHKWLNVPYDSGIAFCADPAAHRAAMEYAAPYLTVADGPAARDATGYCPEFSRRARGVGVYAAVRQLGRSGIADLVAGCCRHARAIAEGLAGIPGCEVVNDVVLNQVLFRFSDDDETTRVLAGVLAEGDVYPSPTVWDGRGAIRMSVSNWRTDTADVVRAVAAVARAAAA